MEKSDLMEAYTITDSSCGSKSKWALVHLCTCKAAANRSNVYVSGKNNKILPIPETMQGISTSAESKEERRKKKSPAFVNPILQKLYFKAFPVLGFVIGKFLVGLGLPEKLSWKAFSIIFPDFHEIIQTMKQASVSHFKTHFYFIFRNRF
jgi:hypothetical protein